MLALYIGRLTLRRRRRSLVAVVLLLALGSALSLFAVVAARRTQSAYPRFLRAANASTLSVGGNQYDPAVINELSHLPQVVGSRAYVGMQSVVMAGAIPDGRRRRLETSGTFDGRYYDQDRFVVVKGRRPNPARAGEVAINEYGAQQTGLRLGQRFDLGSYAFAQFANPSFLTHPPPPEARRQVTLVGIGLFPDEVLQDDADRTPRLLATPAFTAQQASFVTYEIQGLVLRRGDRDIAAVKREIAATHVGAPLQFRPTSVDEFHALEAMRPLSIALGLFGAIAAVATVVLVGQALARVIRLQHRDQLVLRSFGLGPAVLVRSALVGPAVTIGLGLGLGAVLAVLASPLSPIGAVRRVEPTPGVSVDPVALIGGFAFFAVSLLAVCAAVAWIEAPHRLVRQAGAGRPSSIVAGAASAGMAPPAVAGLRLAFESGDRANPVSSRTVMAGAVVAIAAIVASTSFGASLHTLLDKPSLYGWNWDTALLAGNGYGNIPLLPARQILAHDPAIAHWSGGYFGADAVNGTDVPLLGLAPSADVRPPLLRGRMARSTGEIVLGPTTASQLGVKLGDWVSVGGAAAQRRAHFVGIATFPTVGIIHSARTSLGIGALVVPQAVPGWDRDITGQHVGDFGPRAIFIRYRPGTDLAAEHTRLVTASEPLATFAGLDVLEVQRPAEIVNSSSVGSAPIFLAIALALGAVASLALAVGTAVKVRGRDLALLKTLGFTRRQLALTVAWHATATVVVGLVVGVPLGMVVGPSLWRSFARQLNVVAQPTISLLGVGSVMVAALVVANLAAAVPARTARRVDPARLLRVERQA